MRWFQDVLLFFFVKQKTAYEMRISDWSSDVCSSDLFIVPAQRFDSELRTQARITSLGDHCQSRVQNIAVHQMESDTTFAGLNGLHLHAAARNAGRQAPPQVLRQQTAFTNRAAPLGGASRRESVGQSA